MYFQSVRIRPSVCRPACLLLIKWFNNLLSRGSILVTASSSTICYYLETLRSSSYRHLLFVSACETGSCFACCVILSQQLTSCCLFIEVACFEEDEEFSCLFILFRATPQEVVIESGAAVVVAVVAAACAGGRVCCFWREPSADEEGEDVVDSCDCS